MSDFDINPTGKAWCLSCPCGYRDRQSQGGGAGFGFVIGRCLLPHKDRTVAAVGHGIDLAALWVEGQPTGRSPQAPA